MRKLLGLTMLFFAFSSTSGLLYGRNFASQLARFTSVDPVIFTKQRIENPQGFNLYPYVQNNPLKYVDPNGKDIAVIENGPTTTVEEFAKTGKGNPVGHTAFAATGRGVYSAGNDTKPGSSMSDYVLKQAENRDTKIVIIKTTPEQDQAAINSFMSTINVPLEKYPDNCSNRTNQALDAAGIPLPALPSAAESQTNPGSGLAWLFSAIPGIPGSAADRAQSYNASTGTGSTLYVIKGTTTVPNQLQQFNPGAKPTQDDKKTQTGDSSS